MNYGFTLQVAGIDTGKDDYEDILYDAGCADALVVVVDGTMFLDFHRDGATFEDAVESASQSIERAGGKVVTVSPLPE